MSGIGTWVKKQRTKRRMSQQALGEALEKSRTWVSSLERGTFRPRVEDCAALGAFFDVELGEVLALSGYSLSEIAALRPLRAGDELAMSTAQLSRVMTPEVERLLEWTVEQTITRLQDRLLVDTQRRMLAQGWTPPPGWQPPPEWFPPPVKGPGDGP